jgi:hypothetical protein
MSVPDDPVLAFGLFRAGDARGIAAATHGLALAYWDGIGTRPTRPRGPRHDARRRSRGFRAR